MIGIIDYGLGNVKSFINSYRLLGLEAIQVKERKHIEICERFILPGVGSFDAAMSKLEASGLLPDLENNVLRNNVPILGVCVGLQILSRNSEEGTKKGLGWLKADVKLIKKKGLPIPHMGWNTVFVKQQNSNIMANIESQRFYFLHSYHVVMDSISDQIAVSHYGMEITAVANNNNVYGCQFHPEKSHSNGLKVLENFAGL